VPSSTLSPAPVLVTGGAGFIGSHLVDRLLAEGHRVVVVDNLVTGHRSNLAAAERAHPDQLLVEERDVCDEAFVDLVGRHRPEVILHLAAQMSVAVSVDDPVADAVANVVGTVRVLEAAGRHGVGKVVFTSSGGAIYGEVPADELPLTEDHPGPGLSPYGAAKRAGEEYVRTFSDLYGFAWSAIAPANVYGPRQDAAGEGGVIARFIQRMIDDEPCRIHGDGEQTRDFIYVTDVVDAFLRTLTKGDGERFNVGTGHGTSVNRLFGTLAAATGYSRPAEHGPARLGDVRHNVISPTKSAHQLGWKPATSLEDGIAATVDWARGGTDLR
jgi:UDP-glucose 4-epimerase